jgi:predicted NUDIX family NTP pyrophosphohydrolase
MAKRSAGVLLYRLGDATPQVLLVHPGGPFWARRDLGAWSIPKGEHEDGEDPLACARRELEEELGAPIAVVDPIDLGSVRQKSGKVVQAWAAAADFDPSELRSNTFTMQWPPRSGRMQAFPEVDRAGWFSLREAREKLIPAQAAFVDRLAEALDQRSANTG